jgi:hypothetical protein
MVGGLLLNLMNADASAGDAEGRAYDAGAPRPVVSFRRVSKVSAAHFSSKTARFASL